MKFQKAYRLINKILKQNPTEAGIFISILANQYMIRYNITQEQFLKSLKNSLKILENKGDE